MRFAFLIYVARSGSTLLARQLDGVSPDLLVTPEWNVPIAALRLGETRLRALDAEALSSFVRLDRQIGNLELDLSQLEACTAAAAGGGVRRLVEALAEAHAAKRGRAPRAVVIKNSAALWVADALFEAFPEAVFVHIVRDGRAVVNSLIHTESSYDPGHPMGRGDPVHCARLWTAYLDRVDQLRARWPERLLTVVYESLIQNEAETLAGLRAELATRLGVELPPGAGGGNFAVPARERGLHALVGKPPQAARAEGWKSELSQSAGIAVESIQAEHLRARGYPLHFLAGASPREIAAARARETLRHAGTTVHHAARRAGTLLAMFAREPARARAVLRDAVWERVRGRS